MQITLFIIGGVVIASTLIPLLRAEAWWIRLFDFPRLQIAFVGAAALILYLLFVRNFGTGGIIFVTVLSICLFY